MTDPRITRLSDAIAETIAATIALAQTAQTDAAAAPEEAAGTPTRAPRKPKTQAVEQAPEPETEIAVEVVEEPVAEVEAEPEPATMDRAKALTVALSKAHGRDAVVALLADYGAAKCSDLADAQIADYCADAEGRIAA